MKKELKRNSRIENKGRKAVNKPGSIEDKLKNGTWKETVKSLTMPEQMRQTLMGTQKKSEKRVNYRLRYAKALPAACMALIIACTGITAHAVYQNTHFRVFFEQDVTRQQISQIAENLEQIEGVSSCRYVDGDTAWKEFGETYLTPELAAGFESNPLSESANLEIGISLTADAAQIIDCIEELDGVRLVSSLSEE